MEWAEEEFAGIDLGDARLSKRLMKLAEAFSRQPEKSIPATCRGWPETKGAYRFFENQSVTPEKIQGRGSGPDRSRFVVDVCG